MRTHISILHDVGLVPLADVQSHIPTDIEIISLTVRAIMVTIIQSFEDFFEKRLDDLIAEVIIIPIWIDADVLLCGAAILKAAGATLSRLVVVLDEVEGAGLDVKHKRRVIIDCKRTLDAVALEDRLDLGCDTSFFLLIHMSHD